MNFFKYLLLIIFITLFIQSCNNSNNSSQDQVELIKVTSEIFLDNNTVLYHQTYDKDFVERVVGNPITDEIINRNIYLSEVDMDSLFDERVLRGLNESIKEYQSIDLTTLNLDLGKLVTNEEIPDYVRDQSPLPPMEVEFTSVLYLSTPIVYKNRAIVLTKTSADMPVGINFYKKEEGNWIKAWD